MRTSCLRSIPEATALIADGATIGVGGSISSGHPMAVLRELIRAGTGELTVVAGTAGLDVDLLIAHGCVAKTVTAYVGCESIAPIGPAYRDGIERGSLQVRDLDEAHVAQGLRAAAQGLPFLPWRGGVGTSLPELNSDLVEFLDPIRGERLLAVPALELDVAIVVADEADEYGNARLGPSPYMDLLLANAARTVIVQAERIVDNAEIRRHPELTSYWSSTVVVDAPKGTHPYAGDGLLRDDAHLIGYVEAANELRNGDRKPVEAYLSEYVTGCADEAAYLQKVGAERLRELEVER